MIIRKPSTIDIVKIANLMIPENAEEQSDFVSTWIQKQQEAAFLDFVVVHKKKVIGFFAGELQDTHLSIMLFRGESSDILQKLWDKAKTFHEVESAALLTSDPDLFITLGFEPTVVVMNYQVSNNVVLPKGSDSP